MEMKKSLDIYGQGFICIDDMVYLDEIDEYVTKEEYEDYVEYISKHNTNKD